VTSLEEYIKINAPFMTMNEMAEETGISYTRIFTKCKELNIVAIKPADRVKEYILANRDKTVEEIATHFDITASSVGVYAKELNLKIIKPSEKRRMREAVLVENKPKVPLGEYSFSKQEKDALYSILADVVRGMTPDQKQIFRKRWVVEK
jgi:hypothetical protein